jgi:diaminohydroxyphosphoribosylaminopyrimidine deaminase/5-amino-6-(5-phosphoribosylamino)uracil reductase
MDILYMTRAIELAIHGEGQTSPNPMVGAVLVHKDRIIGEGFHARAGLHHAEVEAINSVKDTDKHLISQSTLYVTLEPCCFQGRTPACTSLIIEYGIPRVVIGTTDLTADVSGKGIQLLKEQGIQVDQGICIKQATFLAGIRNTFVQNDRPYVVLKYTQSQDGFIGKNTGPVKLSNPYSLRFVHRLRQRFDAIMVGTNTAIIDNPLLSNRLYGHKQPVKVILDRNLRIPPTALIFKEESSPIHLFCFEASIMPRYPKKVNIHFLNDRFSILKQLLYILKVEGITSLLVEGGNITIQNFIEENLWDESYVSVTDKFIFKGIDAPTMPLAPLDELDIEQDTYFWYLNDGLAGVF